MTRISKDIKTLNYSQNRTPEFNAHKRPIKPRKQKFLARKFVRIVIDYSASIKILGTRNTQRLKKHQRQQLGSEHAILTI